MEYALVFEYRQTLAIQQEQLAHQATSAFQQRAPLYKFSFTYTNVDDLSLKNVGPPKITRQNTNKQRTNISLSSQNHSRQRNAKVISHQQSSYFEPNTFR